MKDELNGLAATGVIAWCTYLSCVLICLFVIVYKITKDLEKEKCEMRILELQDSPQAFVHPALTTCEEVVKGKSIAFTCVRLMRICTTT
jgi:hypothetical protein